MQQCGRFLIICLSVFALDVSAINLGDDEFAHLESLYLHLHQNPELSFKEERTALRIAQELEVAGFEVTHQFGGTGVVATMTNGPGPTVLIRGDMDALPVAEQTGLEYASKITGISIDGEEQAVMHACGHDVHMTVLVGTARALATQRDHWQGTLIIIAQPAEERGAGAKAMLDAGLFTKFPRPDYNLALHVSAELPAGKIGYVAGPALANVDSVDITVYGVGGHGAYPHLTKDPVVLSAQIITALQTIVSRELSPLEPAVLTVGSIHGGQKHNVIPNEVKMQLTLRSYTLEVREKMIAAIRRIVKSLASAADIPSEKMPSVEIKDEFTPVAFNNPSLTHRIVGTFVTALGADNVVEASPVMGGEDFGRYGQVEPKIPSLIYWLGAVDRTKHALSQSTGSALPSLHSAYFAPEYAPTIRTGVTAMTAAALELLENARAQ
ncbi:MAG: amidohydrolase [Proteobacteria bacterium]|nr:amidohydrolase [Pseudomonadota bacterium]